MGTRAARASQPWTLVHARGLGPSRTRRGAHIEPNPSRVTHGGGRRRFVRRALPLIRVSNVPSLMGGDAEARAWPEPNATAGSALPSAVPNAREAGARAARRTRLEPALRGRPHRNRGRGGATARDRVGEPLARRPRQRRASFWRTSQATARTVARQSHSVHGSVSAVSR
jgi:hypothetical protein